METTTENVQNLASRYNECARRFKILYALARNYPQMGMELSEQDLTPPMDLNLSYGKLNVVRKLLEASDVAQIPNLVAEVERELAMGWSWFEQLDRKLTPFLLRVYCESNREVPTEHLLLIVQFLLNKVERTEFDQGKVDYLLTHCLALEGEDGIPRLRAMSEQELKQELLNLLPEHLHYQLPALAPLLEQYDAFLAQLNTVSTFDDLISGNYINKGRQLKNMAGPHFYNANILTKCVQLNTLMRQKFLQLYQVENERIRNFSHCLINAGNPQLEQYGGEGITPEKVIAFSENSRHLLNTDYSNTNEYITTFVRIREVLDKAISFYGLDPAHNSGHLVEPDALDETRLAARLIERQKQLRELVKTLPERAVSSVQILKLERFNLVISHWEKEALLATQNDGDAETRLSRDLLARTPTIIAEIHEAYAHYKAQPTLAPHLADTQLMMVNYFVMQAHKMADDLETLSNRMREQGRIEKACDLSATRHKLLDTCWKIKI